MAGYFITGVGSGLKAEIATDIQAEYPVAYFVTSSNAF